MAEPARSSDSAAGTGGRVAGLRAQAIALLAPPRCLVCRAACSAAAAVCARCADELAGMPLGGRTAPRGQSPAGHFAAFPMRGAARSLVHALKFDGGVAAAAEMARLIAGRAPPGLLHGALLVPAPAHPGRRRERGYNQTALLAGELARLAGARVADCLWRRPGEPPQTGLSRERRLMLSAASIAVRPDAPLGRRSATAAKTNVLVVDDVATTGVTLELCASAIGRRTAAPVGAVTFAAAEAPPGPTRSRSPGE